MKNLSILLLSFFCFSLSAQEAATQDAVYNGQSEKIAPGEIRLLTYNIKMLPRLIARVRYGQLKRSRLIPAALINDKIDIVVFEEAFDVRCRRILKRKMKSVFPYKAGPANRHFIQLRTNSGIMIFSKYPLKQLGTIDFEQCKGEDCLAHKGALMVEVDYPGQKFQVLGTHLEAGGPESIKISQYHELKEMSLKFAQDGVPQFLCGDFNTHKSHEHQGIQESEKKNDDLYEMMMDSLQALDGDILSDYVCTTNPFSHPDRQPPKCEIIDFILVKPQGVEITQSDRYVRRYKSSWNKKYEFDDLSDHNAVLMRLRFAK